MLSREGRVQTTVDGRSATALSSSCHLHKTSYTLREGLKVPPKQPKRARLWLNDGSCVRLAPIQHVWNCDFTGSPHNGSPFRILNVIDE